MNKDQLDALINWLRHELPGFINQNTPKIGPVIKDVHFEENELQVIFTTGERKRVPLNITSIGFVNGKLCIIEPSGHCIDLIEYIQKRIKLPRRGGFGQVPDQVGVKTERLKVEVNNEEVNTDTDFLNFLGNIEGEKIVNKTNLDFSQLGVTWKLIDEDTQLEPNFGYVINNNNLNLTLPKEIQFGDTIKILDFNGSGFTVLQNDNQQIIYGIAATTVGSNGNLASFRNNNSLAMVCVFENNKLMIESSVGNFKLE